jgi:hypothetical protein
MTLDLSLRTRPIQKRGLQWNTPVLPSPRLWYVSQGTPCGLSPQDYSQLVCRVPAAKQWGWRLIRR